MRERRLEILIGVPMLLFLGLLSVLPEDERHVAAPAFACIFLAWALWVALSERDGEPPIVHIGMLCAVATTLYTVYPLVNYWIDGMQFGLLAGNRLRGYDIQPDELGLFHWRHVLYLACFVTAYFLAGRKSAAGIARIDPPDGSTVRAVLVIVLSLMGWFAALQFLFGVNFHASYEEGAFGANVAAMGSLPLIVRQVSGKFLGILFFAKIVLLCLVVSKAGEKRWFWIMVGWVAFETVQVLVVRGARSEFMLLTMASVLFYHRMIRPLSVKAMAASAVSLFLFFLFLGLYRTYMDITTLNVDLIQSDTSVFATGNEFQALFGTAYDVLQLKEGGAVLPWYLRINDFVNLLPPQQLLPFEKVSAAEWYLREINLSGTGIGLMWGVIAQSIVGEDWYELAVRGALLGFLLARFHRWYSARRARFAETAVYVFFCVKIYYTFRDNTFSLLTNFVWEIVPFWAMVTILGRLRGRRTRLPRPSAVAGPVAGGA